MTGGSDVSVLAPAGELSMMTDDIIGRVLVVVLKRVCEAVENVKHLKRLTTLETVH